MTDASQWPKAMSLSQLGAFFNLHCKLITRQRSCNRLTVTIELFAATVNG